MNLFLPEIIDVNDFPQMWMPMNITVDVEAKSKEVAVLRLMEDLSCRKE